MATGKQIRAARQLVDWTADDLAERVGVSKESILHIEREDKKARTQTMGMIISVFDAAGIEFTDFEGVRRKPSDVEIYIGIDRFQTFLEFMYNHLQAHGGEVCISVTDERKLQAAIKDIDQHRDRMNLIMKGGKVVGRILASSGNFKQTWAKLRRQPKTEGMPEVSFYAFGDCLALISLEHNPSPYVVLHKSGPFAAAYKQSFDAVWEKAEEI